MTTVRKFVKEETKLKDEIEPPNKKKRGNDEPAADLTNDMGSMKIETLTEKNTKELKTFYKGIHSPPGSKLAVLHQTSLLRNNNDNTDFVQLLADIAAEQKFTVTYVYSNENNDDNEVHCLVQLSTMPVAVCFTAGKDKATANVMAARAALQYLKIMTKKKGQSDF